MWIALLTILVFGLIIFIHELGHFVAAKLSGVRVSEFALGMGPKIFSFGKNETKYCLRLFPIGGSCSMEGEDTESSDERAFCCKPIWKRLIIIVAGAVMNLLLGYLVLCCAYGAQSHLATNKIAQFNEGATSSQSGLQVGDEIVKINNRTIFADNDIIFEILNDDDGDVNFVVKRDGEKIKLDNVHFKTVVDNDQRLLDVDFKVLAEKNSITTTLSYSANKAVSLGRLVWISLGQLVTGQVGFDQLSGPVGVGKALGEAASVGFESLLIMVAFLSINVGIFNLLPLPALDGGRLLFLIIEAIRRKPIKAEYEGYVHAVGILLLFGLMIVVTLKDILHLF